MERVQILNSSGKNIGYINESSEKIEVHNGNKPVLCIANKEKNQSFILELYDTYTLTIAEIAAIYREKYYKMREIIKSLPTKTEQKSGRRNSSYGAKFSDERLLKISEAQKGRPCGNIYTRTPEIKAKISRTLKNGYKSGRIVQDPALKSKAWADGKYNNVKMGRGIQGYFYSDKMQVDMYFRSLLELSFIIILETNNKVEHYIMEPFQISLPHSMHYTPDVIINNKTIVELKTRRFSQYTDFNRFCLEIAGLNDYCNKTNHGYIVIYDDDINFESKKFRNYIKNNPEIVQKYNVRFKKEI